MSALHPDGRLLVMHVVYSFAVGGLENGVVNLLNHMPASAYRHMVLALLKVDDANVVKTDIECSNGVIHVIDAVVMPK